MKTLDGGGGGPFHSIPHLLGTGHQSGNGIFVPVAVSRQRQAQRCALGLQAQIVQ